MTKQEFLAFSLPYGLKCKELGLNEIFTLNPKLYSLIELLNWSNVYQPLLRPLSDLTKEIEHKGEKFVPIIELAKVAFTNSRFSFELSEGLDKFVWIDDDWNNFKFYFEGIQFSL